MRFTYLALVSLSLAGCAGIPLTLAGEAVSVVQDPDLVRECEYIDLVPGVASQNAAEEDTIRELRNAAGILGANFVLMVMETRTIFGRAEGYLCTDGP